MSLNVLSCLHTAILTSLYILGKRISLEAIVASTKKNIRTFARLQKYVWSADGNIDYLGSQDAPFFAAAVGCPGFPVPPIHPSPPRGTVALQVSGSTFDSFNVENEAIFGCSLWLLERKPSLLVWDSASDKSLHSTSVNSRSIS